MATAMKTRRVKFLMVDPAQFMGFFTKGMKLRSGFKLIDGVPKDATLLTVSFDSRMGSLGAILLVVESSEYEPIPINEIPPIQAVEIRLND